MYNIIYDTTDIERCKRKIRKIYYSESNFFGRDRLYKLAREKGIDISRRQLWDWLKSQMIHQLYMPSEESKELQSTVLNKPHEQIGIDLIDMSNYNYDNYKYILTGIDLFSKKAYSIALKDKSQKEINKAIKKISVIYLLMLLHMLFLENRSIAVNIYL